MSQPQSLFSDYKDMYLKCIRSITQTHLIAIIASHTFNDFPRQLPKQLKNDVKQALGALAAIIESMELSLRASASAYANVNDFLKDYKDKDLVIAVIEVIVSHLSDIPKKKEVPFREIGEIFRLLVRQQALAMVFAHLEAFIADSLRVMCRARPHILKKNEKQVPLSKVLQFPRMEDFIDYIIEDVVYNFGFKKNIGQQLDNLIKNYDLSLHISDEEKRFLVKYEKRRNLIIHNGGIVSQRYIEETRDTSVTAGQILEISMSELRVLFYRAKEISSRLFVAVSSDYLGIDKTNLPVPLYQGED